MFSVTLGVPAIWPSITFGRPGPWPVPTGIRPLRSGSPKVVVPLPPKVVPSKENTAVFCAMDMICPWQKANPRGAKLPANILMMAKYSSIVVCVFIVRKKMACLACTQILHHIYEMQHVTTQQAATFLIKQASSKSKGINAFPTQ